MLPVNKHWWCSIYIVSLWHCWQSTQRHYWRLTWVWLDVISWPMTFISQKLFWHARFKRGARNTHAARSYIASRRTEPHGTAVPSPERFRNSIWARRRAWTRLRKLTMPAGPLGRHAAYWRGTGTPMPTLISYAYRSRWSPNLRYVLSYNRHILSPIYRPIQWLSCRDCLQYTLLTLCRTIPCQHSYRWRICMVWMRLSKISNKFVLHAWVKNYNSLMYFLVCGTGQNVD